MKKSQLFGSQKPILPKAEKFFIWHFRLDIDRRLIEDRVYQAFACSWETTCLR